MCTTTLINAEFALTYVSRSLAPRLPLLRPPSTPPVSLLVCDSDNLHCRSVLRIRLAGHCPLAESQGAPAETERRVRERGTRCIAGQ